MRKVGMAILSQANYSRWSILLIARLFRKNATCGCGMDKIPGRSSPTLILQSPSTTAAAGSLSDVSTWVANTERIKLVLVGCLSAVPIGVFRLTIVWARLALGFCRMRVAPTRPEGHAKADQEHCSQDQKECRLFDP
jgi:hypothetical protein